MRRLGLWVVLAFWLLLSLLGLLLLLLLFLLLLLDEQEGCKLGLSQLQKQVIL